MIFQGDSPSWDCPLIHRQEDDTLGALDNYLQEIFIWVQSTGFWAPALFILLYLFGTTLFVPATLLTIGAGIIFGWQKGSITALLAATITSAALFLSGRYLGRGWLVKKIEESRNFIALDKAIESESWKIVLLIRLSPVMPFNFINFTLGLTSVPLKTFVFVTALGMIPGILMYVYTGSVVKNLAAISTAERSYQDWILIAAGLIITVGLVIYLSRKAKKILENELCKAP